MSTMATQFSREALVLCRWPEMADQLPDLVDVGVGPHDGSEERGDECGVSKAFRGDRIGVATEWIETVSHLPADEEHLAQPVLLAAGRPKRHRGTVPRVTELRPRCP